MSKIPVQVEVAVRASDQTADTLRQHVLVHLRENEAIFKLGSLVLPDENPLSSYIEAIEITELGTSNKRVEAVSFWQADLCVHIFTLSDEEPEAEILDAEGDDSEETSPCSQWTLPRRDFHGLWDSLILENGVKDRLVNFAASSLRFSRSGVREHVISANRMVLLHGPPGTGKTTMCKALAHKLAIRLSNLYESSILIEIHSHSLFSKWFSESGKLVARLFEHITELVEEPGVLVFVLIDEVESLTTARSNSGSEPSDAVRVVNAMLTQLDRLKRHPNVLTLCTTNLASSIDAAFVDRADIKAYIGLPPVAARYTIFRDCVLELTRVCLIAPAVEIRVVPDAVTSEIEATLLATAQAAEGLSGRTLRKLPFLAHATYIQQSEPCTTLEFTRALQCAVADELAARSILASDGMASSSGEGCSSGSGGGGGGCHVGGEPQGFTGGGSDP